MCWNYIFKYLCKSLYKTYLFAKPLVLHKTHCQQSFCFCFQCRLIVAQMSDQRCDAFNLLLIPLSAVVACVWILPTGRSLMFEQGLLYLLTTLAICAHTHYGTCVVRPFLFSIFTLYCIVVYNNFWLCFRFARCAVTSVSIVSEFGNTQIDY